MSRPTAHTIQLTPVELLGCWTEHDSGMNATDANANTASEAKYEPELKATLLHVLTTPQHSSGRAVPSAIAAARRT